MNLAGFEIPARSPVFMAILALHVPVALLAIASGAAAMLARKRRGSHSRLGTLYFWSLGALFATSTALAAMRWREDYALFALGAVAFGAALFGRLALRRRWSRPIDFHIVGMGVSYIVMLTAFYVDNGERLPVWKDLPHIAYWTLPAAAGVPIVLWARIRYRRVPLRLRAH